MIQVLTGERASPENWKPDFYTDDAISMHDAASEEFHAAVVMTVSSEGVKLNCLIK